LFAVTPAKIQLYTLAIHAVSVPGKGGTPTVFLAHVDAAVKIVVRAELGIDQQVRKFYM
jgi:hypothetical protein